GGAERHDLADAAADGAVDDADGEPGQDPALAVRGAVPGPEPDAAAGDPRRAGEPAGVGRVPGLQPGPGAGAVGRGGDALPPGEAGDLDLRQPLPRGNGAQGKAPAIAGPFFF